MLPSFPHVIFVSPKTGPRAFPGIRAEKGAKVCARHCLLFVRSSVLYWYNVQANKTRHQDVSNHGFAFNIFSSYSP